MKKWTVLIIPFVAGTMIWTLSSTGAERLKLAGWEQAALPGVDLSWVNPKLRGHVITYVKNRPQKAIGMADATDIEIVSGISAMRQITLEQFGFTNWKLDSFKVSRQADEQTVEFRGTYVRPDKVKISFIEHQVFKPNEYRQLSYLAEDGPAALDSVYADEQLKALEAQAL